MKGMQNFLSMMHESGVTTAADMGTGIFGNPVAKFRRKSRVASDPVVFECFSHPSLPISSHGKNPRSKRLLKSANGKR